MHWIAPSEKDTATQETNSGSDARSSEQELRHQFIEKCWSRN